MNRSAILGLTFIGLVFSFIGTASAQGPATGFPPYGSFEDAKFDGVNLQNLNVNFGVPIINSLGRGMNLGFGLSYDSSMWVNGGTAWYPVVDQSGNPIWGWESTSPTGSIRFQERTLHVKCNDGTWNYNHTYSNYLYYDRAGTWHSFPLNFTDQGCTGNISGTQSGSALDGSGYFMSDGSEGAPTVANPSGISTDWTGKMTDTNGNFISSAALSGETDWYDTAHHNDGAGHGRLRIIPGSGTTTKTTQYQFLDVNGAYQTIAVTFTNTNIKTAFLCSGPAEYTGTGWLPTSISLPNGKSYTFTYEPTPNNSSYVTGRIQRVMLPTGGYYEYDYGTTNDGINCSDGSTVNLTRKINDGTNTNAWTYTRALNGSNWTTTETTPAGDQNLYTFNSSAHETQRLVYQGSSPSWTLQRTINTTWASNGTPATQITILEDNSTQNEVETNFDSYGNLLLLKEHDWGAGAPGGPVRTTTNTFVASSTYTNLNIMNLLQTTTVADSTGATQSRTDIAYDGSGGINTPCITGAVQHDDSGHGCSFTTRGLPTSLTTYPTDPVGLTGPITKAFTYDSLGNLRTAQVNCCNFKTWNYSVTTNYAYPDSVVSGSSSPQLTTSATYNAYTGQVATSTDENSKGTTLAYADPGHLNRLTSVTRPDNAQISYVYDDTNRSVTVTTPVNPTNSIKQATTFDGLGRPSTTSIQDSSNNTYSIAQTQYDVMGRAYKSSNPYTGSPSYWTTTLFDALGRPTSTKLPDNSATTYSYAINTVTITDPAGRKRKTQADGLGRLASVFEPDSSGQPNQQTSYAYTVLDALAAVTGVGSAQTRSYGYDHMGRLTSVATPETNNTAMAYQYDSFSNLTQRTDPRGVITTYGYDTLNRLQTVSYNVGTTGVAATASVGFTYGTNPSLNNNGRLITLTDGVGSENYSYDPNLPLTTQVQKVVSGTTYTTNYGYNQAGELTSITYPSGRVVQQSYDKIGRLCAIAQTSSGCSSNTNPYATGYGYNTASELTGFNYANGVAATFGYSNDRLQMTSLSYAKGGTTLYSLNYSYGAAGSNNGQIQGITDNVDNGRSMTYSYDSLARLATTVTTGSTAYPKWGLSFTYDAFGNRTIQSVTAGTAPSNSVVVNTATNRITTSGYGYDANGNMTNDGSNTLSYDAENHLLTSSGSLGSGTYTYDGNGLRVKKVSGSTTTVYAFSGTRVVAEYVNGATPTSPTREYVYSGGALLAKIESGTTQYYHTDHLSTRLMTDSNGNKVGEQGNFPYGETWYASSTTTKWQFTSYERDAESGNDYAVARYLVNRLGRFSSPDLLSGSTNDPQSLNHYTYVLDDPINHVDPSGLDCEEDTGGGQSCDAGGSGAPDVGGSPEPPSQEYWDSLLGQPVGPLPGPDVTSIQVNAQPDNPIDTISLDSGGDSFALGGGGGAAGGIGDFLSRVKEFFFGKPNPCPKTSPSQLDYSTPRQYANGPDTPLNHITINHILPSPGNSQYIFQPNVTSLPAQQSYVISVNAVVFLNGSPTIQTNGNIIYTFIFPPMYDPTTKTLYAGVGKDVTNNNQITNTASLVIEANCTTVVTSFPGK
jgi:RHS repeat-associated protein